MNEDWLSRLNEPNTILVTASNRQSRYWRLCHHASQVRSKKVWHSATIIPWHSWIEQLYTSFALTYPLPTIIHQSSSREIWKTIVQNSPESEFLVSISATTRLAIQAWQIMNDWNVSIDDWEPQTNEQQVFLQWLSHYEKELNDYKWKDEYQRQNQLSNFFKENDIGALAGKTVLLVGFLTFTPSQKRLMTSLEDKGVVFHWINDVKAPKEIRGFQYPTFDDEIRAAGEWFSHELANNPHGKFALIVPDLEQKHFQIDHLLKEQLHPEQLFKPKNDQARFNFSVGQSLLSQPPVRVAFSCLQWLTGAIATEPLSELLRFQNISIPKTNVKNRMTLSYRLPQFSKRFWSLEDLLSELLHDVLFEKGEERAHMDQSRRIEALKTVDFYQTLNRIKNNAQVKQSPEQWAVLFGEWLKSWDWLEQSGISSDYFQMKEQCLQHIAQLKYFNSIKHAIDLKEALKLCRSLFEDAVFKPKSKGEPIQVLGLYESIGLKFDGVWISGMSDDILPEVARPNPFLSLELSRSRDLPGASAEKELRHARMIIQGIVSTSENVRVSYYQKEGDREFIASPVATEWLSNWEDMPALPRFLTQLTPYETECFNDEFGMPFSEEHLPSGIYFIQSQSQCPILGYIQFRLGIEEQEESPLGMDPRERGSKVHKVMQLIWETLKDQHTLISMKEDALVELVESKVEEVFQVHNEKQRLLVMVEKQKYTDIILSFLAIEKDRTPFKVVGCEQPIAVQRQGLTIKGRIDRLDKLENESLVVIDYKTGLSSSSQWLTERLGEPQLPLYWLALGDDVSGLAFANLHHKKTGFVGISQQANIIPDVIPIDKISDKYQWNNWPELKHEIELKIDQAIFEIKQGFSAVSPSKETQPCRYCPYDSVCRIKSIEEARVGANDEQEDTVEGMNNA